MERLREIISGVVYDALCRMGDPDPNDTLNNAARPRHSSQGDLSIPCFSLAKTFGCTPQECANKLAEGVATQLHEMDGCARVVADGGFCNFHVDTEWLASEVIETVFSHSATEERPRQPTSLMVEHTSANPNGPFHVGRSRNAILGDTIVRLHRLAGDEVRAEYYVDDMGKQVGILAWALENLDEERVSEILSEAGMNEASNHEFKPDHQRVRYYQAANLLKEVNPEVDRGVTALVQASEVADEAVLAKFEAAYQPVLDGMLETLARMGIGFDSFTKESQFIVDGSVDEIMRRLAESELHRVADNGAHFLELESRGVQGKSTRFFYRRGDGSSLYATRDIAYHEWKWTQATHLVNILGEDHRLQSKQVGIALDELGIEKPEVVFYSFTKLPEGKMSTRRGNVVFMDDLLDEAASRARSIVQEMRSDLCEEELTAIGEAVGVSAVRFNIIRVSPDKGINFRWQEALSFESDSAPFIMYSHARACSIRRRVTASGEECGELIRKQLQSDDWAELSLSAEALVKRIALFSQSVDESLRNHRPNLFCTYMLSLATDYNRFYRDNHVVVDGIVNARNLTLSEAARTLLRLGCEGLGISPIESM